ncbi:MAG TPA: DinB family protein [Phycisphaerales bacterium]|nr:DinB family protein [Phycisphaerales bacterium]
MAHAHQHGTAQTEDACCKTGRPKSQGKAEGGCCGGGGGGGCGCSAPSDPALVENLNKPMTAQELATLPTMHLVMRSRRGLERLDRRVFQLSERQIDQAFLPEADCGRWPVRVLVGHLADAEIAATHRMRRIVAEENPTVCVWDEDAFVDANLYQNAPKEYAGDEEADHARVMNALGGSMAVIHTLRTWAGQWLMTLDDSGWERRMMHPQRGPVTLRDYVAINTWHLEHHAKFLAQKLDRMLGPAHAGSCGCGH